DRHVREHANPDLAATLDVASHGTACRFDLACRDVAALGRLQTVLAEGNGVTGLRQSTVLALELLAEFGALRLQHGACSLLPRLLGVLGLVLADIVAIQHFALENPDLHTDH